MTRSKEKRSRSALLVSTSGRRSIWCRFIFSTTPGTSGHVVSVVSLYSHGTVDLAFTKRGLVEGEVEEKQSFVELPQQRMRKETLLVFFQFFFLSFIWEWIVRSSHLDCMLERQRFSSQRSYGSMQKRNSRYLIRWVSDYPINHPATSLQFSCDAGKTDNLNHP